MPLFLSDPDGEPDPQEFAMPLRKSRITSVSSRILMAVVAASGAAMMFAWFSSDSTRDLIENAKASIAGAVPPPAAAAPSDGTQLSANDVQLKAPGRSGGLPAGLAAAATAVAVPAAAPNPSVASVAPSRDEISNAYQSALQSEAPAAAPVIATPAPVPAPPPRRIEPEELALLMKRAKDLLGIGDIPAARLLLERAADAHDPTAALMLARTYDPDVLGTSDVRNITPEPAKARTWYQKAAQFGSSEAQRRLAQLQN